MAKRHKKAKQGLNKKLLYGVVLVTIVLLAVLVVYYLFFLPHTENWTAAIIDQVAIEGLHNQTFNITSTSILNASGFKVRYYPAEGITVSFYKDLSSKGGKVIILRVHSSVRNESDFVDLFTSEPYNKPKELQYSAEYGLQLSVAEFFVYPYNKYFAVGPTFVDLSMRGRFDSSCVVVLMGCSSLEKTTMAEALVRKGAKVVIGWTRLVELNDTDKSTLDLLHYLLAKDPYTIDGAVKKINNSSHPYGTKLDYYPKEASNYKIPTRKNEMSLGLKKEPFQVVLLPTLVKWKCDGLIGFF